MPSVTMRTARKARPCGNYPCHGLIKPGDLYVRHIAFPSDEGHEEGTTPWVIEQCRECADRSGDWLRAHYGVPARVGMRVEIDGQPGRIYGFDSGLRVLLDDGGALSAHPTWRIVYHTPDGPQAFGMEG